MIRGRKNYEVLQKEIERNEQLINAAAEGNVVTAKKLLDEGSSPDAAEYRRNLFYAGSNYLTPLQYAAKNGHVDCVHLLLQYKADVNAFDRFDVTAVHIAAEHGRRDCLKLLLDANASCNVVTKYSRQGYYTAVPHVGGTTPLHLASLNNHPECIEELIWSGADYNAVDELGRTSLFIAADSGFSECLHTQLNNAMGRDILSLPVKDTGDTPLHACVAKRMASCISSLLCHGSDVNHRNSHGMSPLHLAVAPSDKFSMEILRDLITEGYHADVNLPDTVGMTPLHSVCFKESFPSKYRTAAAVLLIQYGADVGICNKQKYTLLEHELQKEIHRAVDRAAPSESSANQEEEMSGSKQIILAIAQSVVHLPNVESLRLLHPHPRHQHDHDHERLQRQHGHHRHHHIHQQPRSPPILQFGHPPRFAIPAVAAEAVHVSTENLLERIDWYRALTREPRSLQHYCRCAIRQSMGPKRLCAIRDLPYLPSTLNSYLLLQHDFVL